MSSQQLIIGITGTLGAGKGTIVEYLVGNHNFKHYSAREFISAEIKKRDLPLNRDSMRIVADDLRKRHSPSVVIESLYNKAKGDGSNAIIESIRCPGEIDVLENTNFILFAVDANSKIRHQRILIRGSETDDISYEQFIEQEKKESNNTEPFKMNLPKCISKANYQFDNNGTIEQLHKQLKEVLEKIENGN